jgi:hypothetical protein
MAVMTGELLTKMRRAGGLVTWMLAGFLVLGAPAEPLSADDDAPARLLYVHRENDKIIASNVLFNRSDEFRLSAQESVEQQLTDNAILVLATNRRLIAYSVYTASWVTISLKAGEELEQFEAEDFSAFAVTSKRVLSFNGRAGQWSETRR